MTAFREPAPAPLLAILEGLIAAWKAGDLDRVLAALDDDVVWHYAAPGAPPLKGKVAARKLLTRLMADMNEIGWRIFHHAETADRLFVEGVDEYVDAEGRRIVIPYAGVLDFRDGLIVGWRDYVDLGVIERQKAGEAPAAHVETLIGRSAA